MPYRVIKQLHLGHILFLIMVLFGGIYPEASVDFLSNITNWFGQHFSWLVLLCCAMFIVFCAYIAMSRYGMIRLGASDERPAYGLLSWLGMLFAAGMGTGLVFYGVAEPLIHYYDPPPMLVNNAESGIQAREALAVTYFHWGIHAWAIYAVAALTIAYFTFRLGKPMLPSVSVTSNPALASIIDSIAIIAVVFGIVGALSQGVLQLSDAVIRVGDLGDGNLLWIKIGILVALCIAFIMSATTGIGKGIRILSDLNMGIAFVLMVFILFAGPTEFLLKMLMSGIGDYLGNFVEYSFNMRQFADRKGWMGDWTITLFLWWIAWAPFVGVFVARISRGRTLREFMAGVILAPTGFSLIWFATLGGSAMDMDITNGISFTSAAQNPERATFMLLEALPMFEITAVIAFLLLFIFLVTSADSGAYVLGMFTRDGDLTPPVRERLFWGLIIGIVAIGSVLTGKGTPFFRSVAIFGSLPYLFIMLLQLRGLWRALKQDEDAIHPQLVQLEERAAAKKKAQESE